MALLFCGCSKDDPAETTGTAGTSQEILAIVDDGMETLYNAYSRFFPQATRVSVDEALAMTSVAGAKRIVLFSSLGDDSFSEDDNNSSLARLWKTLLKPARNKAVMLLAVGEGVESGRVVTHTGVDFGGGLYLKSMAPAGNVFFQPADRFNESQIAHALESLYDDAEMRTGMTVDATPQTSTASFSIKKLYTGTRQATINPSYTEIADADFTFSSTDVDKIAIMLDVEVKAYSYPGSTDRYAEVTIRGAGIQPRLDLNNGTVLTDWHHSGHAYIKNLAQYYFFGIKARQNQGAPLIYSYLPTNQLSSTNVSNSHGLSLDFSLGKSLSTGVKYAVSQTVSYSQKDFQTVANRWSGSGSDAVMEWKVWALNINGGLDAWVLRGNGFEQEAYLNTNNITYTEIPIRATSAFVAKQSDLPQPYSLFAPDMKATIYTSSSSLNIQAEGGVVCQNTEIQYNAGARWLGSGVKFSTKSFSHHGSIDIDFGNGEQCLMDSE